MLEAIKEKIDQFYDTWSHPVTIKINDRVIEFVMDLELNTEEDNLTITQDDWTEFYYDVEDIKQFEIIK